MRCRCDLFRCTTSCSSSPSSSEHTSPPGPPLYALLSAWGSGPGAILEGSRERVAPASTPVYGGPWDRRICRVATLRSASASRELRALKKLGLGQSEGRAEEEEPKTARPSGQYRGRVHRPRLSEQELQ